MDRSAAVIVGGVGLVVLVLVAFVWAGPDAMRRGDGEAVLAAAERPAPALRSRAATPQPTTGLGTPAPTTASTPTSGAAPSPTTAAVTPTTGAVTPTTVAVTPTTGAVTPTTVAVTPTTVAVTPTTGAAVSVTTVPASPPSSAVVVLPQGLSEQLDAVARVVRFPYRSATLDPAAADLLDRLAPDLVVFLAARPEVQLLVRGHTDDSGPEEGNLRLGADRARVVIDRLVARGIPGTRLRGLGAAASMPIADNTTDDGRAANRRVDIVVVPTETAGS